MSAVFVRVMAEEKGFTPRVIDVLVNVDNITVELRILIQVDHKAFGRKRRDAGLGRWLEDMIEASYREDCNNH